MSHYAWKPYISVAKRREKAEKVIAKAKKTGAEMSPINAFRGALAKTFWGKAWCDNLERYSDYANRLPRGRTYVRNGSVIDLQVDSGKVSAQVMGSSLYRIEVTVKAVPATHWKKITADCTGSINTLVELLQGKLSKAVMERISKTGDGLFPAPKEINFTCSCPDWASMCKHVAAVLYGIGNRLDQQPELLFDLRGVNATDLVANASNIDTTTTLADTSKVLDSDSLADVFGIELASVPTITTPARKRKAASVSTVKTVSSKKPPATKSVAKTPAKAPAKASTKTKPAAAPTKAKVIAKTPAKTTAKSPTKTTATKPSARAAAPKKPAAKVRKQPA